MQSNSLLSIVIPTYNRADFLDYSLEVHIPQCKEHNIQIFISDNASTDSTEEIAKKWMNVYEHLYYTKNETNIGPDANFEKALKMPDTDYVWLLSDTYLLPDKGLEYILNVSKKPFDVIVFNLVDKIRIPTKEYADSNEVLYDLGAVMTCAAINVYNKNLIQKADFSRYYNSYFIQTGIIFEEISKHEFCIHWAGDYSVRSIETNSLKKTNWSQTPKAFEIGCDAWTNFVMSLPPSYKLENKMKCIMDFGKISGLFTLKNLFMLRIANLLNYRIFSQYKSLFRLTVDYPLGLLLIISLTPRVIFKLIAVFAIVVFKREKINKIQEIMRK